MLVEDALVEGHSAVHRGELIIEVAELAVLQGDVATVTVDVVTVDIAVVEVGDVDVVGTEDTPVGTAVEVEHIRLPDVVHQDAVAVIVGARVGAVDVHVVELHFGAVADADGIVGRKRAGRRIDVDVAELHVVLVLDIKAEGLELGILITIDGDAGDHLDDVRHGADLHRRFCFRGVVRHDGLVGSLAVFHQDDIAARVTVLMALALVHPQAVVREDEQMTALAQAFHVGKIPGINGLFRDINAVRRLRHAEQVEVLAAVLDVDDDIVEEVILGERYGLRVLGNFNIDGIRHSVVIHIHAVLYRLQVRIVQCVKAFNIGLGGIQAIHAGRQRLPTNKICHGNEND